MKAVLSIKPEFVDKILKGEKKFEYRKKIFKQEIESVVIYSSKPIGKLVGEFKVKNIIHDDKNIVWNKTNNLSGISYKFFNEYFNNHDKAYALEIEDLIVYEEPMDPKKLIYNFKAPQSFCYIKK